MMDLFGRKKKGQLELVRWLRPRIHEYEGWLAHSNPDGAAVASDILRLLHNAIHEDQWKEGDPIHLGPERMREALAERDGETVSYVGAYRTMKEQNKALREADWQALEVLR